MTTHAGQWGPWPFIDLAGNARATVQVTVYDTDGGPVSTLYADRNRSVSLPNPLPTGAVIGTAGVDTAGNALLYAEPGTYWAVARLAGVIRWQGPIDVDTDQADIAADAAATAAALAAETAARSAGDVALASAVTTEATARAADDTAEATARGNADATNAAAIAAEVTRATTAEATKATDSAVVHNMGAENVAGVKTFASLPVLPGNPTTALQPAAKQYVDAGDLAEATARGLADAANAAAIADEAARAAGVEGSKVASASLGQANGVATLGGDGILTAAQRPPSSAFDPTIPLVVRFGGAGGAPSPTSAAHGPFWPVGVDLGHFSWEFWSCLDDTSITGYLLSEGKGGDHALLCTVNAIPQGNIWNGVVSPDGSTSFSGGYTAQIGEWLHSRFGWDGTFIYVWINGILVNMTRFAGPRRAQQGELFIAGSDHSNFTGRIAGVRGWEGTCPPFSNNHQYVYTPDRVFSPRLPMSVTIPGSYTPAQFCVSYLGAPSACVIPDTGDGFGGLKHPGVLQGMGNGTVNGSPQPPPGPRWVADATAPFSLAVEPARTRTPPAPVAAPAGSKIWDSMGRADSIPAFTLTQIAGLAATSPGSTEGGSLGPMAWNVVGAKCGIFDGAIVCFDPTAQATTLWVQNDSADMDVRADRHNAVGYSATAPTAMPDGSIVQGPDIGLMIRMQDANNSLYAAVVHDLFNNKVVVYSVTAGVGTLLGTWTLPNYTWTTLRINATGTTITGYVDATQIGQVTGVTAWQTASKAGLRMGGSTAARIKNFRVA